MNVINCVILGTQHGGVIVITAAVVIFTKYAEGAWNGQDM
jgi:hypothetical protein